MSTLQHPALGGEGGLGVGVKDARVVVNSPRSIEMSNRRVLHNEHAKLPEAN